MTPLRQRMLDDDVPDRAALTLVVLGPDMPSGQTLTNRLIETIVRESGRATVLAERGAAVPFLFLVTADSLTRRRRACATDHLGRNASVRR